MHLVPITKTHRSISETIQVHQEKEKCSKSRNVWFTLELQATPPHTSPSNHPATPDTHERLSTVQDAPDEFDSRARRVPSRPTVPAPIPLPQTVQTMEGPGTQTVQSPTTLQKSSLQASLDTTPLAQAEHVSRVITTSLRAYATGATPPSPAVHSK